MKRVFFTFLAILVTTLYSSNPSNAAITINPVENKTVIKDPVPTTLKGAVEEFKSLSRKEKKERIKELKKEVKKFKEAKRSGAEPSTNTLLLVILAILLPPLAVYLHQGEINNKFWISLILTLLFWIPGVIYALIVVLGADN
jgi:uncharacterized membrane protein YqaE (UPF0057 family)